MKTSTPRRSKKERATLGSHHSSLDQAIIVTNIAIAIHRGGPSRCRRDIAVANRFFLKLRLTPSCSLSVVLTQRYRAPLPRHRVNSDSSRSSSSFFLSSFFVEPESRISFAVFGDRRQKEEKGWIPLIFVIAERRSRI